CGRSVTATLTNCM
ncbi:hypothetical protein D046_8232B, partial [Vibrio parahaemolyticus V-223/04]